MNYDYKILMGILAARLAKIAPFLINPDQVGFVSTRQIHDLTYLLIESIDLANTFSDSLAIITINANSETVD